MPPRWLPRPAAPNGASFFTHIPIYFIDEEFVRAVAATDLPHDFTLEDLHWPMPAMVAEFPTRFMQECLGRDVCYVYAASSDECRATPFKDEGDVVVSWGQARLIKYLDGKVELRGGLLSPGLTTHLPVGYSDK